MRFDESRRAFLKAAGAAVAVAALPRRAARAAALAQGAPSSSPAPPAGARVPTRRLGRTGVEVSLIGIGGAHLAVPRTEQEAIRIVREAIDHGVTFLDNSWDYHEGESERRMGKALEGGYRDRAFLMTKVDGRTAGAATEQLDESLRRLRTDHLDLLQIHEVIRMSDPRRVFGPGGAIEALVRARDAGKTRFLGFTGHKSPHIHLSMLDTARQHGFRFDAVQMPLNVMDAHYDSFEKLVLPVLQKEDIGVLGMKPMGAGIILQSGAVSAVECLRYALTLPTSVVITGCDSMGVLRQALDTALAFEPLGRAEKQALLARTAQAARAGEYERYKTSARFDSTAEHPEWMDAAQVP